jgi:hypothetical protein
MNGKLTRKEAFEKIKGLLNFESKVKMENAKLADGTIIQWDGELGEGSALSIVDESGNVTPAPDATHELEDGTKVTTVGGMITAIAGPAAETEVEPVEEMASEFAAEFANHLESFNALVERLNSVELKLAEYESKFSAINESVNNAEVSTSDKFAKVLELVEKISEEPAAAVNKPENVTFKKVYAKAKNNKELFLQFAKENQK